MAEDGEQDTFLNAPSPVEEKLAIFDDYRPLLQEQLQYLPFDNRYEIDPANLTLLTIIGASHFGEVHLGLLKCNGCHSVVAVKTTRALVNRMNDAEREKETSMQRESLRDEMKIMSILPDHSNIIKMLGATTTMKHDFCLVIEYCEYGGLDSFLREIFDTGKFENELLPRDSASSEQISAEHQLSVEVLHRDVALRNVLLKADFTIRVADFGLSRQAGDRGYYFQSRDTDCPFRYIAPESLRSGRFSKQSELWSFGVVLWELFTFAKEQPYSGKEYCGIQDVSGILDYLDSRQRLHISEYTPPSISTIMTKLWHDNPFQRPSFMKCQDIIEEELLKLNTQEEYLNSIKRSVEEGSTDVLNDSKGSRPYYNKRKKGFQWTMACIIILALALIVGLVLTAAYFALKLNAYRQTQAGNISEKAQDFNVFAYTASNNDRYQFMQEWNLTTNELNEASMDETYLGQIKNLDVKRLTSWEDEFFRIDLPRLKLYGLYENLNVFGYMNEATSISLQPVYGLTRERNSMWYGLYLKYDRGNPDLIGFSKLAIEAENSTAHVVYHSWLGEESLNKSQYYGDKTFMPYYFDNTAFSDGFVKIRFYYSFLTRTQSDTLLEKETLCSEQGKYVTYTASNNEKYQFMLKWNLTAEELKQTAIGEKNFGPIDYQEVKGLKTDDDYYKKYLSGSPFVRISFDGQPVTWPSLSEYKNEATSVKFIPFYIREEKNLEWIGLYLKYDESYNSLEHVGLAKLAIEMEDTTATVVYHSWMGEEWLQKGQSYGTGKFLPFDFDETNFEGSDVKIRFYWSFLTGEQTKELLKKEIHPSGISSEIETAISVDPCCPIGWTSVFGSYKCIKTFSKPSTWTEANDTCADSSGYLVSIHNTSESQSITRAVEEITEMNVNNSVWIGGRNSLKVKKPEENYSNIGNNSWHWTDNSDFDSFVNWKNDNPYEPDCSNGECLRFAVTDDEEFNGKWSADCCIKKMPFVCELQGDPIKCDNF